MENGNNGSSANSILRNCMTKVSSLFRSKSTVAKSNRIPKTGEIVVPKSESKVGVDIDDDTVILRHQNTPHNQDSTNDIDKSLVAESEDVVTPLPSSVGSSKPFAFGNGIRPEIVEIIRHMDSKSLRLNNLTMEDRSELLKRHGKEDRNKIGFRNSTSCPSFTSSGLYQRRMRENEHRLRLNIRKLEVLYFVIEFFYVTY